MVAVAMVAVMVEVVVAEVAATLEAVQAEPTAGMAVPLAGRRKSGSSCTRQWLKKAQMMSPFRPSIPNLANLPLHSRSGIAPNSNPLHR